MKTARHALLGIAALGAGSAPALATTLHPDATTTAASAATAAPHPAATGARTLREGSPRQRVCVRGTDANSRIVQTVCRTRAEWDSLGGIAAD